ncbi:MAG: hypothetical protein A2Y56_11785 [Candidatus Aminicenantes bacterium RBG_13_63_10]|nr:MAG: hypothetical protein A2Y56_11785 [Candidatus Aminicenantes bacterium RBG_13_63_10]
MRSEQDLFHELSYYTLSHPDPSFIHQHIVDAFAAQRADGKTKRIALTFALVGLYLHLEKGYTGRRVQLAHMEMARKKRDWPAIELPDERGDVTVSDVLAAPPGAERDSMIDTWCASVWGAYKQSHAQIARLARDMLE